MQSPAMKMATIEKVKTQNTDESANRNHQSSRQTNPMSEQGITKLLWVTELGKYLGHSSFLRTKVI